MSQIVTADIEVYDPATLGPRTLRYATQGFNVGAVPTMDPTVDSRLTVARSSVATRVDFAGVVRTVAANAGRIDHDPATFACTGFLREPSRTNLCDRSAYNAGTWTASNATISTGIDDPEGGTTAVRFAMTGTPAARLRVTIPSVTPSGTALYALSFWVRLVSGSGNANADLGGGVPSVLYASQLVTGAWRRITVVATPTATAKTHIDLVTDLTATMTMDFWGLQLELGEWATSLIETAGAIATRTAEDISLPIANYSATAGTVFVEASVPYVAAGTMGPLRLDDGTASNRITIATNGSGRLSATFVQGGTTQADLSSAETTITAGVAFRAAAAYSLNDFALCCDGRAVLTDAAGTVPTGINRVLLGENTHGASIRRVTYWATRLTNLQLVALTNGQTVPGGAVFDLTLTGNAQQHYEARIEQPGSIMRTTFRERQTSGSSQIGFGAITMTNADGGLDGLINYGFAGRPLTLRLGTQNANGSTSWATVLRGTVEQADVSWQTALIRVRDRMLDISQPIQQTRYAGSNALPNGLEGLAQDLKGRPKPIVFGTVWNIAPPCVNTDRNIYQIHEGSAIQSIGNVYDRGVPLSVGPVYTSQADMESNTPASNHYRMWNSAAGCYIRSHATPTGLLTADVSRGAAVANRTVGQLYQQILLAAGVPQSDINAADITALDAAAGYECGVYVSHQNETNAVQLLDQLVASVGAWYGPDAAGVFRLGRIEIPTSGSATTITATDVLKIERVATRDDGGGVPVWKVKVGYKRIQNVQDDLGSAVTELRRAYFAEEFRRVETSDATIKTAIPLAPEIEALTVLAQEADAASEAARLLTLYKTRRDMYEVTVRVDASTAALLDLGKVVTLQLPRFGMAAGKLFLIVGITTQLRGYQFQLTLWG